jgi:hypothetical protein
MEAYGGLMHDTSINSNQRRLKFTYPATLFRPVSFEVFGTFHVGVPETITLLTSSPSFLYSPLSLPASSLTRTFPDVCGGCWQCHPSEIRKNRYPQFWVTPTCTLT